MAASSLAMAYSKDPAADAAAEHRALLDRIARERDLAAFESLFDHFGPRIKAMMLKAGADGALADDIVQDVMLNVWQKVEQYSPERGSAGTWIFTIARNARIDKLRHSSSRPYDDIAELELASEAEGGEAEAIASQEAERVALALAELPEDQREIVELAYMDDLPQSSIAEKLGLPLGTVKSRLRLAYGKLRRNLEDLK